MSQTDLTQNSTPEESPQTSTPKRAVSRRRNGMGKGGSAAAGTQAAPVVFGEVSDLQNVTEKLTGDFPDGRPERKPEHRPERQRPESAKDSATAQEETPQPPMRSAPKFEEKESSKENWAPSRKTDDKSADGRVKKLVREENKTAPKGFFARLSTMLAGLFSPTQAPVEEQKRNRKEDGSGGHSHDKRKRSRGRSNSRGKRGGRRRSPEDSSRNSSRNRDNSDA